ncbi:PadR family transcriptional regulator [Methanobrevibacter sp. DSM 116169]|uniref:PadR family transcriptional regulator n=1 Tax=Methanobrevibacter sp. DSM 116169 TaxID=3242727 RepID=UPI0038FC742B
MKIDESFCKENDFEECNFKMLIKNIPSGLIRMLILWIISQGKIHGYKIMKYLDEFFTEFIKKDIISNFNSSKIYPILHEMENEELIIGDWDIHNNKKVKYYTITKKGEDLLNHIKFKNKKIMKNDLWVKFLTEMGFSR